MDINATFIGQIIVFLIMLWFIAKVVVPMIAAPISERHKKIADGLAAGERGQKDLVEAESRVDAIVREARVRAQQIEAQAQAQANEILEAATDPNDLALGYFLSIAIWLAFERAFPERLALVTEDAVRVVDIIYQALLEGVARWAALRQARTA